MFTISKSFRKWDEQKFITFIVLSCVFINVYYSCLSFILVQRLVYFDQLTINLLCFVQKFFFTINFLINKQTDTQNNAHEKRTSVCTVLCTQVVITFVRPESKLISVHSKEGHSLSKLSWRQLYQTTLVDINSQKSRHH